MATTTQLFDPTTRNWNTALMDRLGIPSSIFLNSVLPGTHFADLSKAVCEELDVPAIKAVAVGSHDTESAIGGCTDTFLHLCLFGLWNVVVARDRATRSVVKA